MAFASSFGILKNPDYRKYFIGQLISMSGTWMQSVAQSWLVYRLTNSGYWLGIISACGSLPAFLINPIVGVIVDRHDRRKILMIVETCAGVQAMILAFLVFAGLVQVWHVVALAVFLGLLSSFEMTTRHTFAVDMVGKGDLSSAIGLNSVLMNVSRVSGPAFAGFLLKFMGEGWCFLLNGLSYIPVVVGFALMKVRPFRPVQTVHQTVLRSLVEAFRYVKQMPVILGLLLLCAFVCLVSCPYAVILPVFATKILHGDAGTLAWLTGFMGMGAVTGALSFPQESDIQLLKRKLMRSTVSWGLALILFGVSRVIWLSFAGIFLMGYFMMTVFPIINNTIQQLVDDSMRGRVLSLYTMTFLGAVPLGGLIVGPLSDRLGASLVVIGMGSFTILGGLSILLMDKRRRKRGKAPGQP